MKSLNIFYMLSSIVGVPLLQFGDYTSFSDRSMKIGTTLKDDVLIQNFERDTSLAPHLTPLADVSIF